MDICDMCGSVPTAITAKQEGVSLFECPECETYVVESKLPSGVIGLILQYTKVQRELRALKNPEEYEGQIV